MIKNKISIANSLSTQNKNSQNCSNCRQIYKSDKNKHIRARSHYEIHYVTRDG